MSEIATKTTHRAVSVERKTLASIWTLANQQSFRAVADRFGFERGQLQRIFLEFCENVSDLKTQYIEWPSRENCLRNMREFEERWGYPGVVGAIDGTDITIKPPQENRDSYINRKGVPSVKLQAVCSPNMHFMDVYCGWSGSVHDARVFRNSPISHHLAVANFIPDNSHILGDNAYPLQLRIMTPFRDNGHMTETQTKHNKKHSSSRQVIERSFALLKGKWRRLKHLDMDLIEEIPIVIMAACILHNIILKYDITEEVTNQACYGDVEGGLGEGENRERNPDAVVKRIHIADLL